MKTALFPPMLFPPVAYYAIMNAYSGVAFDTGLHYMKAAKSTHRFTIADTRGRLRLTVPVSHPTGARTWAEVTVSDHGRWWETMPIALESAYGRTPFFEFYIDRLRPLFSPAPKAITALCLEADSIVRRLIDIPVENVENICKEECDSYLNYDFEHPQFDIPEYWQIRGGQFGFIANLSILDLLFNLGPESALYLDRLSTKLVENC